MDALPDELVDRICSFLSEDLPTFLHVSSRFRRIASPHLLAWLAIPVSDVQAGTVELVLSKSLHLIIFVAHICPIRRLVCFRDVKRVRGKDRQASESVARFARLASILAATAPIPDVLIHYCFGTMDFYARPTFKPHTAVVGLLARLPQTATHHLLVPIKSCVYSSRPAIFPPVPQRLRLVPPFRMWWRPFDWDNIISNLTLILVHYSLGLVFTWAYRVLTGREWSVEARLTRDLGDLLYWDAIRIQMLPEKHTLVTFQDQHKTFELRRFPRRGAHTPAAHAALLANLDRGAYLKHFKTSSYCDVTFADLFAIVDRHQSIRYLTCSPYSLTPSWSFPVPPRASNITHLSAPPAYIPDLLRIAPNVEAIYIIFPFYTFNSTQFDHTSYRSALDAIAEHPGSTPLTLSFTWDFSVKNLPWQTDVLDAPELRLHRVTHLLMQDCFPLVHLSPTDESLVAWLGRFPSLHIIAFQYNAFKDIREEQGRALTEAVRAVCPGLRDLYFHVPPGMMMPWG
ncbi:hypothetical protein FB45DRAFT_1051044 [Roridomyces roridus]|uniref:F-box domain-containing protein n=1 Tax=Roridomyces roridus TaxID=1738132 RepID=A0AAD7G206_9AGAR|nr:hypothetical protein FB45DRAFT_1051044 [Roridomyces roridus]